jgi:Ca2+/H+ antiporter, TMEM165/GDT1 family
VALAARFYSLTVVTIGTTLGMLIANAPVVLFGDAIAKRLPLRIVRVVAALLFVALGLAAILMPASR